MLLAGDVAHKPAARILGLAGYGNVSSRFGLQIAALRPVERHLLDETEGIREALVVLGQVGGHLQRRGHYHVDAQLVGDRAVGVRMVLGVDLRDVHFEDAGRVVHRASDQPREGQHGDVRGFRASEGLILRAAGRFVADQIGPRTAESRRTHGFVGVDHDPVVGGLLHGIEIVVHHPLVVVVVALGDDVADVSRLDGRIAVFVHEAVGSVEMPFVVAHRTRCLVVHDHLHALFGGVALNLLDVEVGIRGHEVENIILHVAEPVLPADVPSLDQHGIHAVRRGEVDVAFHVGGRGAVTAVGPDHRQIVRVEVNALQVVGVGPAAPAGDHLPPDAHVFTGADPRRILDLAGLVQIEREPRGQDVAGVVRDDHRPPGGRGRGLHVGLVAVRVGGQVGLEDHRAVIEFEVHGREVDQCRLVEIDVESVIGFQLQGGLHAGGRKGRLREIVGDRPAHVSADLREARAGVVILLGVVVAGDPPGGMVPRHGELRALVGDDEVDQIGLYGKFVAESEPVVEEPEADGHPAVALRLAERDAEFVVVVADRGLLTPDGLPRFIERGGLRVEDFEFVAERFGWLHGSGDRHVTAELCRTTLAAEQEAHAARFYDDLVTAAKFVTGRTGFVEREVHQQIPVRGAKILGLGGGCREQQGCQRCHQRFHDMSVVSPVRVRACPNI